MDPAVIAVFIPIVSVLAVAAVLIARVFANRPQSLPTDVIARLDSLEGSVQSLQQQLTETQERLDFTERLLTKGQEERSSGPRHG